MQSETRSGIHPLVATASVAVIVLAGVGVAAFTGVLPGSSGSSTPDLVPTAPTASQTKPAEAKPAQPKPAAAKPAQPKAETPKPTQLAVAPQPTQVAAAPHPVPAAKCTDCGVVESVQEVEVKGQATGAGAVAGGVAGAVIGNQIGEGRGKTAARVLGAAGGAVIGHQVERNVRSTKRYDVAVRMEDGTVRTLSQEQPPTWRTGDKVRVVNDALQAR
jgi:outer membrane lipoprotein SlyB